LLHKIARFGAAGAERALHAVGVRGTRMAAECAAPAGPCLVHHRWVWSRRVPSSHFL